MNNTTSGLYFQPSANGNRMTAISYFAMTDLLFRKQRHGRFAISRAAKTDILFLPMND
jgi:hypothetical protein